MSFISDVKRRRARGDKMRPFWQIAILLLLYPIYWIARQIVNLWEAMHEVF